MIGEKVLHFDGKGTDLSGLQGKIESYLQGEGFTVQTSAPGEQGTVIQAKKGGWLSGVIAAAAVPSRPTRLPSSPYPSRA